MKIIHEISTPEEKEEFFNENPQSLFKYRSWDNEFHKLVITNKELYFSSPEKFNDPYDCGLPFKQHPENFDPAIIKFKVEQTAPNIFPGISGAELEEKCAKQVLLIQQNPESWFEMNWGCTPDDLNKLFGVLSLTPHATNYLMWSHYAQSHKGFCVEFNTRLLVESILGHYQKVIYSNDIPYFSIMDLLDEGLMTKLLYTKSRDWEYEDEYRITRLKHVNVSVQFDPEALIGIYFGYKMSPEQQVEIIDKARPLYPNVKFYQMQLSHERFELEIGQIKLMDK
jgi:hypothetical protein